METSIAERTPHRRGHWWIGAIMARDMAIVKPVALAPNLILLFAQDPLFSQL